MMFSAIIPWARFGRFASSVLVVSCGLAQTSFAQDTKPPSPATTQPTGQLSEEQKIEALIKAVQELKDAVFVRSDKEYEAKAAADHLRMKWEYAGPRIKTARHFITLIAGKSSVSGNPYLIRFKDGRETTSEAFLGAELEKLEATASTQPTTQPAAQASATDSNPPAEGFDADESDVAAIALADLTMKAMGGRKAWDETRYIAWNFFGSRRHIWDKHTGNVRIEFADRETGDQIILLMNISTLDGHAWRNGDEVADSEALTKLLKRGQGAWINDGYWLFMPYKLKDPGVTLNYLGEKMMEDGRPAEVVQLTFTDVGDTPQNKYHVYIAKDTQLVEQWDFFSTADDAEPRFKIPWQDWKRHGQIMLSGDRGERNGQARELTGIAVFDELPESMFTSPERIDLSRYKQAASGR